ncbi:hypothetical protein [Streptomyces sp. NPDC057302]|uniref:hypothetical protein n=1 Tax=Streptomyces sp. NPDC057302 TaxID=3346094 RepID=UPI0036434433
MSRKPVIPSNVTLDGMTTHYPVEYWQAPQSVSRAGQPSAPSARSAEPDGAPRSQRRR